MDQILDIASEGVRKGLIYVYRWLTVEKRVSTYHAQRATIALKLLYDRIGDRGETHEDPKRIWLGLGKDEGRDGKIITFAAMEIDIHGACFGDKQDHLLGRRIYQYLGNIEPRQAAIYDITMLFRQSLIAGLHMEHFRLMPDQKKMFNQESFKASGMEGDSWV